MDELRLQESMDLANETYQRSLARMIVNDAFERIRSQSQDQDSRPNFVEHITSVSSVLENSLNPSNDNSPRSPGKPQTSHMDEKQSPNFSVPKCNINETMRKIKEFMDNISFECECHFDSCPSITMTRADKRHLKAYHRGVITSRKVKKRHRSRSKRKDDSSSSDSDSSDSSPKGSGPKSADSKKSGGKLQTTTPRIRSVGSSPSTSKQQGSSLHFQSYLMTPPNSPYVLETGVNFGQAAEDHKGSVGKTLQNTRDSMAVHISKQFSTSGQRSQTELESPVSIEKPSPLISSPGQNSQAELMSAVAIEKHSGQFSTAGQRSQAKLKSAISIEKPSMQFYTPGQRSQTEVESPVSIEKPSPLFSTPGQKSQAELKSVVSTAKPSKQFSSPGQKSQAELKSAVSSSKPSKQFSSPGQKSQAELKSAVSSSKPSKQFSSPGQESQAELKSAVSIAKPSKQYFTPGQKSQAGFRSGVSIANPSKQFSSPGQKSQAELKSAVSIAKPSKQYFTPGQKSQAELKSAVSFAKQSKQFSTPGQEFQVELKQAISIAKPSKQYFTPCQKSQAGFRSGVSIANPSKQFSTPGQRCQAELKSAVSIEKPSRQFSSPGQRFQAELKSAVSIEQPVKENQFTFSPQLDSRDSVDPRRSGFSSSAEHIVVVTSQNSPSPNKAEYSPGKGKSQSSSSSSWKTSVSASPIDDGKTPSSQVSWCDNIYSSTKTGMNVECACEQLRKSETNKVLGPSALTSDYVKKVHDLAKDFVMLYPIISPLVSGSDITQSPSSDCEELLATCSQMERWLSEKQISSENKQTSTTFISQVHSAGKDLQKPASKNWQARDMPGASDTSRALDFKEISMSPDEVNPKMMKSRKFSAKKGCPKQVVMKGNSLENQPLQGIQVLTKPGRYIVKKANADFATDILVQPGQFIKLDLE